MSEAARRLPTLADIEALPPGMKGEIIEGALYTMTRPRARHQHMNVSIGSKLGPIFDNGDGGPGGWWILRSPASSCPSPPSFHPTLRVGAASGCRPCPTTRSRSFPIGSAEILSPSTRRHNLVVKKPFYARVGVPHLWLVDLEARALTALRLEDAACQAQADPRESATKRWVELGTFADEAEARIEPFDAVSFDLRRWWVHLE